MKLTKEIVRDSIRAWEMDAGEDFFDNSLIRINPLTLMTWCYGKGYLTYKQYNDWSADYAKRKLKAIDENYYVYNDDGEYGVSYALVSSDDYNEEDYEKALLIFGEFVCEIWTYEKRFRDFLEIESVEVEAF